MFFDPPPVPAGMISKTRSRVRVTTCFSPAKVVTRKLSRCYPGHNSSCDQGGPGKALTELSRTPFRTQEQTPGPHMGPGHLSLLSRHAFWCTCRRKGKLRLVLFVLELNTNRSNFNFPFLRPVNPNDPRGWILGTVLGGSKVTKFEKYF